MRFIDLLKDIDESWSIDEKARSIYTNIGKNVIYDNRIYLSKDEDLLWEIYNREVDIEEDIEDIRFVCNSISKVYLKLLHKEGIKAELIYAKPVKENEIQTDNVSVMYWNEKGQKRYTNISADIERCRFGLATMYFAVDYHNYKDARDAVRMHKQELKDIDIKTKYIKDDYANIVYELLKTETRDIPKFLKFLESQGIKTKYMKKVDISKYKMEFLTRLIKYNENAGPDEAMRFYKRLFDELLNKSDKRRFKAFEYAKQVGKEIEFKSILQIDLTRDVIYYMYIPEKRGYEEITKEDLLKEIEGFYERNGKQLLIMQAKDNNKQNKGDGPEL